MAPRDRDEPIPLARWIRGRVDIHFRSGHVAKLDVSLHSAHSVRLQADDTQGGESIDGLESHEGWIAARSEEIVLTEWTPDPDYGWRDTSPDDRDRLAELGMRHGILNALADLWSDRGGKPSYSIAAVSALYSLAVHEQVTRRQWDEIAEMVEGALGAELVASAWDKLLKRRVRDAAVDDTAEPEHPSDPSPNTSDDTRSASAGEDQREIRDEEG